MSPQYTCTSSGAAPKPSRSPEFSFSTGDYDFLRSQVEEIAAERRYNLQETLAHAIFDRVAALRGVKALRVRTSKPDVYPEAQGVGVEIASFADHWPN